EKTGQRPPVRPNLPDYEATRRSFSWDAERAGLDGLPGGRGLNIAYEAIDRHAAGARANHLALRCLGRQGEQLDYTYADLRRLTNRFANVLQELGVGKGERVFVLAGRIPELYVAALGTLKNGSVICPLFSAFGPDPLRQRLTIGDASVLVTTEALYRRKIADLRGALPNLKHVLLIGPENEPTAVPGTSDFHGLMSQASESFDIPPTDPEDMALLHFTSGTTGTPKGAVHVHGAVVAHYATSKYALDFHPNDVFWCTADPGWVTGTSYGIIAPLVHGITSVVDEADFDAERWYRLLQDQRVTIWYTAPTAVRMMMRLGLDIVREFDHSALRFIASVGEALNPEAVVWGQQAFGQPIHDNWWQTETGGIMIANYPSMDVKPGSMGRPLPGIEAGILRCDAENKVVVTGGAVEELTQPDQEGMLALQPGWPSMFRAYLHDEERYRKCFTGGLYVTGDMARRDGDGYFWFMGRADDVIKSGGHLIGPFEVESALMEHPAVVEAAVIGKPDPTLGEVVKAFVSLRRGYEPSEQLRLELLGFGRK
ncbi:MAG: acetate--CoA ligase, partial [Chloroflexota bacterium]|nr:acetate--CoA ligase [Chloroflexota bacterium]